MVKLDIKIVMVLTVAQKLFEMNDELVTFGALAEVLTCARSPWVIMHRCPSAAVSLVANFHLPLSRLTRNKAV